MRTSAIGCYHVVLRNDCGNPIILMGLSPGPHKVDIELEDANHHALDKGTVKFVVPEKAVAEKHH